METRRKSKALGLELVVKKLTQEDVERLAEELRAMENALKSRIEYNGALVRAAVKVGILLDPQRPGQALALDVGASAPNEIAWMAKEIDAVYQAASIVPKD